MRRATTNLELAMANGYIGEITLVPKPTTNAVRSVLGLRERGVFTVFYYGEHDAELDELFGYETHNVK